MILRDQLMALLRKRFKPAITKITSATASTAITATNGM
jgi:hypothetical protein